MEDLKIGEANGEQTATNNTVVDGQSVRCLSLGSRIELSRDKLWVIFVEVSFSDCEVYVYVRYFSLTLRRSLSSHKRRSFFIYRQDYAV